VLTPFARVTLPSIDTLLTAADSALRTLSGASHASRAYPAPTATDGDAFGFVAEQIGSLKIGAAKIVINDNLALVADGDVRLQIV
jgi:hypothetical protein